MIYDYLIVGAGLFGSVIAERIANELGRKVLIIDKRPHIGGNCYSLPDEETGIEYHQYGTHIFHTSSAKVWQYITRFTDFNGYHHQVLTTYRNRVYQMPINLETINDYYNLNLTPQEAREFIAKEIAKENYPKPANLEEVAVSSIGRPLYEAFIKGYTIKQWNKDPKELPATIISRLPIRYNYCEDYFVDSRWQGIPLEGYTKIFERLHASENIHLELNCDYFENRDSFKAKGKIIFTGPIDRYFDYEYGNLEWRSLEFEKKVFEFEDFQGTSVMNNADTDCPYTRSHEYRHLHPERDYTKDKTLVFYENSVRNDNEPYYPVNTIQNEEILAKYKHLGQKEKNLVLGGRLGDYAYYDMDKTILAALKCFEEQIVATPSISKKKYMHEIDLVVVMPVYNEEEAIKEVVNEWHDTLSSLGMRFELHVYNDGSQDGSLAILKELEQSLEHLVVHDQPNRGHGRTILHCYKNASNVQWLFQVDSDNEVRPESFSLLWEKRDKYDFLLGRRSNKHNPMPRRVISAVAAGLVQVFFGYGVFDVNSPFRLMRVNSFREEFKLLPDEAFAPNVLVTGIACMKKMRIIEIEIPYQFRQTGTVSINKWKLFRAAVLSGVQTLSFIRSYHKKG